MVPDLKQFVTPELIDEIIRDNQWVHHGAELDDWLGGSCYATDNAAAIGLSSEDAQALEDMPHEQALRTPEFRKCVEHWVNFCVEQLQKTFEQGCNYDKIPPFGPNSTLHRLIRATEPKSPLGVYWTEHGPQRIVRVVPDDAEQPIISVLQVRAQDVTVDWYATLRSRLDYSNGSDEAEIQLVSGSPVKARVGHIAYRDGYMDLSKIVWQPEPFVGIA